jgi:chromosome segregation ATPase
MATVTESELKELKDFISQQFQQVNLQFEQVNSKLNELAIGQARLEERVSGLEKQLEERISSLEKRFEERISGLENRLDDMNNRFNDFSNRLNIMTVGFLGILGVFVTGILPIIRKIGIFLQPLSQFLTIQSMPNK